MSGSLNPPAVCSRGQTSSLRLIPKAKQAQIVACGEGGLICRMRPVPGPACSAKPASTCKENLSVRPPTPAKSRSGYGSTLKKHHGKASFSHFVIYQGIRFWKFPGAPQHANPKTEGRNRLTACAQTAAEMIIYWPEDFGM